MTTAIVRVLRVRTAVPLSTLSTLTTLSTQLPLPPARTLSTHKQACRIPTSHPPRVHRAHGEFGTGRDASEHSARSGHSDRARRSGTRRIDAHHVARVIPLGGGRPANLRAIALMPHEL